MQFAKAVSKWGIDVRYGGAECPVLDFKKAVSENWSLMPRKHDDTEFAYFVIDYLVNHDENALAKEVYYRYEETISMLKLWQKRFENYENFTDDTAQDAFTAILIANSWTPIG